MRFSDEATLSTNSRITTLLKLVGGEERLVSKEMDVDKALNMKMDVEDMQNRLSEFREASLKYLKNSLGAKE